MVKRKKLPPRDRLGRFAPASKKPRKKRKVQPSKRGATPVKRPSLRTVLPVRPRKPQKTTRNTISRTVLRDARGRFVSAKKTVTQKLREENRLLRKRIKDLREIKGISEEYEIIQDIQSILKEDAFTPDQWKELTKRYGAKRPSIKMLEKRLRFLRPKLGLPRKKNERWMWIDQNYFRNRHGIKELAAETGMSESAIWTILMSG